jgi:hypothetical protein
MRCAGGLATAEVVRIAEQIAEGLVVRALLAGC